MVRSREFKRRNCLPGRLFFSLRIKYEIDRLFESIPTVAIVLAAIAESVVDILISLSGGLGNKSGINSVSMADKS